MASMTPGDRVRAALQGEAVDRVPLCFWHHFKPEGSGERMAAMTLAFFQTTFSLDIVKIMPDLLPLYPAPTIARAADWADLPRLGLETPSFREQLVCIRSLRSTLGPDVPLLLTLFSPLAMTFRWIGKAAAISHFREQPEAFKQGLQTLAANESELVSAAIEAGASGIFFSCMGVVARDLTLEEYTSFGTPYDLQVLEAARDGWLNTVHIHADPSQSGEVIYFDQFVNYPVATLSWSDRLTGPSLRDALTKTNKCLMGGLDERGPLIKGSEQDIEREMHDAIAQTGGRRLILANGCSVPDDAPETWLHTARRLVENLS
jgi:uroporphyrinogen decarboxylase